jgi:succinate-acetate transporter protein
MACFCGGLAQLLAGMWEFPRGNAFGGAAFTSYGAFWMSFATILIPGSGIASAYTNVEGGAEQLSAALGIFLITWMIVTFFFFIASLRKAICFIALFGFLTVTFAVLAAGEWTHSVPTTKAGGVLGCITALIAYYIGLAEMLNAEDQAIMTLPLGVFAKKIN